MLKQEARWFGRVLAELDDAHVYPMLNVGSGSAEFRTRDQPWIDEYIFARARTRGQQVVHLDVEMAPGVDLAGDVLSEVLWNEVAAMGVRSVICTNLLEHVIDRERVAAGVLATVPRGGLVFLSCPFRFPFHPDPIDTLFRPSVDELRALFPGTHAVRQQIVDCGLMATFVLHDVRRRMRTLPASVGKRLLRRTAEDRRVIERAARVVPYLFRRVYATCVVLRKD